MLYFAYGSNLNKHQMHKRCPSSRFITKGYLKNYGIYYGGECDSWDDMAYATINRKKGGLVWGAIYEISVDDMRKLDVFEDVPKDYIRKLVTIHTGGAKHKAYAYIGHRIKVGKPSSRYKVTLLSGAKADHLPKSYISTLA